MPTISLREMTLDDAPAMAALEAQVSPEPWSEELFAGELDVNAAERHWLVALENGGDVVGFGGLMFVAVDGDPTEAHLMNIAVDPAHQRKGVATHLLHGLLIDARRRDTNSLTLEVRSDNVAAHVLYRRFGLVDVGTRPGYYQDGADALIMWAHGILGDAYGEHLATLVECPVDGGER